MENKKLAATSAGISFVLHVKVKSVKFAMNQTNGFKSKEMPVPSLPETTLKSKLILMPSFLDRIDYFWGFREVFSFVKVFDLIVKF